MTAFYCEFETDYHTCTRVGMKKSEKKINKIVGGAKSRGKNFGKKSGLADTRKPDDDLRKKVPVLHYTVV